MSAKTYNVKTPYGNINVLSLKLQINKKQAAELFYKKSNDYIKFSFNPLPNALRGMSRLFCVCGNVINIYADNSGKLYEIKTDVNISDYKDYITFLWICHKRNNPKTQPVSSGIVNVHLTI